MSKNLFRGAGLKIAGVLLCLLVFIAAGAMVARFVIGEPDTVKSTVVRSGVYDHLIDASLSNTKATIKKEGTPDIPLNDPIIKDSLAEAFGPNVLRANFESFLDSVYRWLGGSVAQPDFVLDFSKNNEVFIQQAGKRLDERLGRLPACTAEQLKTIKEVEPFKATCLPPGVDIDQIVQRAQASLRTNKDLLPEAKLTADDFKKPGETQTIFASASQAPEQFQVLMRIPFVLLGIIIILCAVIILLSASLSEGLKHLGKNLVFCGVLILLIPLGLYLAQSVLINQKSVDANPIVRDVTLPLLRELGKAAGKVYLIFGSLTLVAGITAWFVSHKLVAEEEEK